MGKIKRSKNLQPWLDYFEMLRSYVNAGYMELYPDKGEAYITQPALLAMTPGTDVQRQLSEAINITANRIRTYAGFVGQKGEDFLRSPFAVHVVKDTTPNDMMFTILITSKRNWLRFGSWSNHVEVITY
jgi:hypothetical protein